MTTLRRAPAAVAAIALAVAVAGCGNNPATPDTEPRGTFRVVTVNVDGRDVRCVTWQNHNAGGISCDWHTPAR